MCTGSRTTGYFCLFVVPLCLFHKRFALFLFLLCVCFTNDLGLFVFPLRSPVEVGRECDDRSTLHIARS